MEVEIQRTNTILETLDISNLEAPRSVEVVPILAVDLDRDGQLELISVGLEFNPHLCVSWGGAF